MENDLKEEDIWKRRDEINNIVPARVFYRERDGDLSPVSPGFPDELLPLVDGLCAKISELKIKKVKSKFLILKGGYGFGKTTILKHVISKVAREGEMARSEIWFISFDQYSSTEAIFSFLVEKAEQHGVQIPELQILKSANEEIEKRKDAAFKLFFHCKMLVIDDIDASDFIDFGFLKQIASEELIILCTCTDKINDDITEVQVYAIPDFIGVNDETSRLLNNINDQQICMQLANNLGPYFGQTLITAVLNNILLAEDIDDISRQFGAELTKNQMIQAFFSRLFRHLSCFDQQLLLCVASMRVPLPINDENPFQLLLQLGLLKKCSTENGILIIRAPNSVVQMIKKLSKDDLHQSYSSQEKPTSLYLWMMLLPDILKDLIEQAENHTWPFVPEAWQYKEVIKEKERYNLKDLIHKKNEFADCEEINILQECLYSALVEENYRSAAGLLFVMDRFIYWQGSFKFLTLITDYMHKRSRTTAIAPQIVIRKARIMKNEGNIQGAEKLLNFLIQSDKNFGQWIYKKKEDHKLVSSVCVQIKGDILRGLGLWTDAAKDLIKSIFGFRTLPKVDIKGWASSLSLLADAFQYMSVEDFVKQMKSQYKLSSSHPVLEAIKCVNEAANLSIYSPLFFMKNKRRAGELMFIFSRMLRQNSEEQLYYLKAAATELMSGLQCHTSIASLESREQFYEFVFCVYKLAQVAIEISGLHGSLQEATAMQRFGATLLSLSCKLYDHYCSFQAKIEHDKLSIMLIQTTMLLLNLPKIPLQENQQLTVMGNQENATTNRSSGINKAVLVGSDIKEKFTEQSTFPIKEKPEDDSKKDERMATVQGIEVSGLQFIKEDATVATDDDVSAPCCQVNRSEENGKAEKTMNEKIKIDLMLSGANSDTTEDDCDGRFSADCHDARLRGATTVADTEEAAGMMERPTVEDFDKTKSFRAATTDSSIQSERSIEDGQDMAIKQNSEDDEGKQLVQSAGKQESSIVSRSQETGIIGIENEATYLTEEDYTAKDEFQKRLKTTMATIEGHMDTQEKDGLEIENTLNILRITKPNVHSARVWRYDPLTMNWSAIETLAYIGIKLELGKKKGACRDAFMVEYINQEEPFGRYVGKQYRLEQYKDNPRSMKQYKQDVICQVTSRYYATLFNQTIYQKGLSFGQVQFLPAVVIELTDVENDPEKYFNVEPFMAGDFTKITNNLKWVVKGDVTGKDLLLAFSHFSFCSSNGKILIVDIQGWTSKDRFGATFLTDPQIHTKDKRGFGTANKGLAGFNEFWASQHPKCSHICKALSLKRP